MQCQVFFSPTVNSELRHFVRLFHYCLKSFLSICPCTVTHQSEHQAINLYSKVSPKRSLDPLDQALRIHVNLDQDVV